MVELLQGGFADPRPPVQPLQAGVAVLGVVVVVVVEALWEGGREGR